MANTQTNMKSVWNSSLQSSSQTNEETQRVKKKKSKLVLKDFIQPFIPGMSIKRNGDRYFLDESSAGKEMPSTMFQKAAPESPTVLSNDNNS